MCLGTDRYNTSWPLPARVAEPQCGTFARMTSLLKLATTATEYVVSFALRLTHVVLDKFSHNPLVLSAHRKLSAFVSVLLDALLWAGLEPRSCHSAGLVLGGRPDARHPDVGLTFCYLSSQDFRESHTVNTPLKFGTKAA